MAGTISTVWPFKSRKPDLPPPSSRILLEITKVLVLVGILAALVYFFRRGGNFIKTPPGHSELVDTHNVTSEQIALCGQPTKDARPIVVEMVYSDDMRAWIDVATDTFMHRCPNIQIKTRALPDIDAADAILSGQLKPSIWAPTDELSLRYLDSRFRQRKGTIPFSLTSKTSLVESPLVLLIWQDRLRLLSAMLREERSPEGQWVRGPCALIPKEPDMSGLVIEAMVPGTWADWYGPLIAPLTAPQPVARGKRKGAAPVLIPAARPIGDVPLPSLEDVKQWGRVKIGHTRPTRDSAGVAALYLMAYDYVLPPQERAALGAADAADPVPATEAKQQADERVLRGFEEAYKAKKSKLGRWLRRCEAGLDAAPTNAPALTEAIFNAGPELYDGVVTYEHLVLPFLSRVDSHAAALRKLVIIYPEPTLLARYPAVLFDVLPPQKEATDRWLRFLLSKEMQEKAIEAGFRPTSPEVTVRSYNVEGNQFLHLRRYGVLLQPNLKEAVRADGALVQDLLSLWGEVTGRN